MLKTEILHPQLARVLAELRHRNAIIIGDAGPLAPRGVERVDLGWRSGDPAYPDVLEEILKYIVAGGAVFADEALTVTPDFHKKTLEFLPQGSPMEYTPHTGLKEHNRDARAIVLTGEFTGYINMILMAGYACRYCSDKGAFLGTLSSKEGIIWKKN